MELVVTASEADVRRAHFALLIERWALDVERLRRKPLSDRSLGPGSFGACPVPECVQ